ncbi:MAG: transcriptional regulator [Acidobacteria bacterium]|nr:MAG: transcriptional regulator [Acidobacteriota bacterium]
MNIKYPIAFVAELLAEPARAGILVALLDGDALPAGELAIIAGVSAQSASGHLSKLVDGGLLRVQSEGRHRYYRIAGPEVGHALEALGTISTMPNASSLPRRPEALALRAARSCYDHLAGRVAVELRKALESSKIIAACGERDYEVGPRGGRWFEEMGIDVDLLRGGRRAFARQCLDWTERTPHLAGALGAALYLRLCELGWIAQRPKTRAVRVTHRGARELHSQFGITA